MWASLYEAYDLGLAGDLQVDQGSGPLVLKANQQQRKPNQTKPKITKTQKKKKKDYCLKMGSCSQLDTLVE